MEARLDETTLAIERGFPAMRALVNDEIDTAMI